MPFLNHVGIAVRDLASLRRLFEILGVVSDGQPLHEESVATEKVDTTFLPLSLPEGVQTQLEFLEPHHGPNGPEGAIGQFLQKKGPGVHHLSFELERGRLNSVSQKLKEEGYRLIYDEPRPGAHGMRVNFIHPKTAGGILIEIMENAVGKVKAEESGS